MADLTDKKQPRRAAQEPAQHEPQSPADQTAEEINTSLYDVLDLLATQVEKLQASLEFYRLSKRPDRQEIVRWHVEQIDHRQDRMDEIKSLILASREDGVH